MEIILTTATAAAGVILNAYALVGDLKDRTEALERIVVFAAAIMLIAPSAMTDIIGLVVAGLGRGRRWPGQAECGGHGFDGDAAPRVDR